MAAVLPSEDSSYFASSLRRSHSQIKFSDSPASYSSSSTPTLRDAYSSRSKAAPGSPESSPPSSPQTARAESTSDFSSCPPTPATSSSIASDFDEDIIGIVESTEDHYSFPLLVDDSFSIPRKARISENLEPPPSPRTGESYATSPDQQSFENTTAPGTPEFGEHAEDDSAVVTRPSQQVDYLSHEWKEEDIWSSWRYIVNRRNEFADSARLENASWRTWMKSKNNLKTISPENLNWLKDCDVTWLYGPLQSGSSTLFKTQTEPSSQALSKTNSFIKSKKPILKKRSMSEVMLQRSLSTASLLKQATASVQAQETRGILRPSIGRAHTSEYTFPFSTRSSRDYQNSVSSSSVDSSTLASPSGERKHIHFNEQVEQCIAVDIKVEEDEEAGMDDRYMEESDSSDEGVMMKRTKSKRRSLLQPKRSKKSASSEGKTIAMLPSTTLKYREDTPEPRETAMKHSTGVIHSPPSAISPSSSQETLRPSHASSRFYLGEDLDEGLGDDILPSAASGWRSPPPRAVGLHRSASANSLSDEGSGLRRTASGMLMPLEEGESSTSDGIFGRVVDTVNTARDIAHVIWNVGWRR